MCCCFFCCCFFFFFFFFGQVNFPNKASFWLNCPTHVNDDSFEQHNKSISCVFYFNFLFFFKREKHSFRLIVFIFFFFFFTKQYVLCTH